LADIQCRALGLGLLCAVESRGETNTIKEMLTLKPEEQASHRTVGALARLAVLLALFAWLFRPELAGIVSHATASSEWVHVLLVPLLIGLLAYHRRIALAKSLSGGSLWGIPVLIAGLGLYSAATWPFDYGYIRLVAIIPVLAGIVLVACGWGVFRLSLPMLLLAMLAIPIGDRIYARLIIRPETYTIGAVAAVLGRLPGVDAVVKGVDVFFDSGISSGVVALGQSNRGTRLLPAFAAVGVFVVFSRIRSVWRLTFVACMAVPVILFCNFFRLLCWAILQLYWADDPTSNLPRSVSAVLSLLLAYGLFVLVATVKVNLFTDVDEPAQARELTYD